MRTIKAALILSILALLASIHVSAGDSRATPAFQKLQALAGDWAGDNGQGDPVKTTFKAIVSGTAVMETLTASGMPEMVTLYSLDGDVIVLVHYCPTDNRPRMRASPPSGDAQEIVFSFQDAGNLPDPAIGHEHRLVIQFKDRDHITERWTWRKNGKDAETVFHFARTPPRKKKSGQGRARSDAS